MTDPSPRTVLQLSENDNLGPVTIDADTFETFQDDFEQRLEKLVDAWKHVASPNAQLSRRSTMTK